MVAELWDTLVRLTVTTSAAVLLVAMFRPVVRRAFGFRVSYGLWALVPALLGATLVPKPTAHSEVIKAAATVLVPVSQPIEQSINAVASLSTKLQLALLVVWGLGAMTFLAVTLIRQRQYWQSLGKLTRESSGVIRAERAAGPALVGVFRPALLLPADFEARYSEGDRALMLAHEAFHRRRRDPLANLLGEMVRCLQWFNPIAHWSLALYRRDQELACDSAAAGNTPDQRARYAELLVKSQLALESTAAPPLGAAWHPVHPLTGRLAALRGRVPGIVVSRIGGATLVLMATTSAYVGWSARAGAVGGRTGDPPIAMHVSWSVTRASEPATSPSKVDTLSLTTDVVVRSGTTLQLYMRSHESGIKEFKADCTPRALEPPPGVKPEKVYNQILIACDLSNRDGDSLGHPQVITLNNGEARIESRDAPFTFHDGNRGVVTYSMTFSLSTDASRVKQAESSQKGLAGGR